ncbi:nucleotidyltransferase family protein [Natrononativus amylolyticus]|uniref:nucleotidyltransferase family protein n=1 Tax=Natrononativus amylolyticus TaxID=2963434 RepID=UPI0020CC2B66|nr:nucleotidyltransferase family protein [Natrononativus amylolyticus]
MQPSRQLPVVAFDAPRNDDPRETTVAAVVLAGGTSSRFGAENKLLAEVDGDPLVRRAVRSVLAASVDSVVVALDYDADAVRSALADLPVTTAENDREATEQSASLGTGVAAARSGAPDALVVALGDMPFVSPETIDALAAAHAAGVGDALAAAHRGLRGNPVLFDRRYFDALESLEGDHGARRLLLEGDSSALVAVPDPGVLSDVDHPTDL